MEHIHSIEKAFLYIAYYGAWTYSDRFSFTRRRMYSYPLRMTAKI